MQSDTTEAEWELIVPHLPQPCPTGRPLEWDWRTLIDGIFYVLSAGGQWRQLPHDFAPWPTTYRYFQWLGQARWWQDLNDQFSQKWRTTQGREADPSAGSLDSQTVKSTPTGSSHGYDAGKKTKGIKHHILVDTEGLLITAVVHDAAIQDFDGAKLVFQRAKDLGRITRMELIWADGIYDKSRVHEAAAEHGWNVQVVKRTDDVKGFKVLPRRWVVERTFSWLMNKRRLSREDARLPENAECFIFMAMVRLLLNRLAT